MWFVKSKSRRKQAEPWPLFQMLLHWNGKDAWSIGDACQGTAVFGATGSGKTTGSGQAIARAFLRAGFGGLVLTAKPGDRANFEDYCRREGRLNDVALFDASAAHRYSFLDEELNRKGSGAGLTENIVNLFSTVLEIAERNSGQGGREDEGYWMRALRQLCRNLVDLLVLARGRVTIPELYRVGVSAATGFEQIRSDEWKKQSFCFQCLADADGKAKSPRQQRDFELVADYFMQEFPGLSDKTRSVVLSTFTSMASCAICSPRRQRSGRKTRSTAALSSWTCRSRNSRKSASSRRCCGNIASRRWQSAAISRPTIGRSFSGRTNSSSSARRMTRFSRPPRAAHGWRRST